MYTILIHGPEKRVTLKLNEDRAPKLYARWFVDTCLKYWQTGGFDVVRQTPFSYRLVPSGHPFAGEWPQNILRQFCKTGLMMGEQQIAEVIEASKQPALKIGTIVSFRVPEDSWLGPEEGGKVYTLPLVAIDTGHQYPFVVKVPGKGLLSLHRDDLFEIK